MISGAASSRCFPNVSQRGLQIYPHHHHGAEDVISSSLDQASSSSAEALSNSLLYNLSFLNDKVHQVQSLVSIFISPADQSQPESSSLALASVGSTVKEIIVSASSILFSCQQMANDANSSSTTTNDPLHQSRGKVHQESGLSQQRSFVADHGLIGQEKGQTIFSGETFDWYGENNYTNCCNTNDNNRVMRVSSNNRVQRRGLSPEGENIGGGMHGKSPKNYDIIELEAADLLAKYTHYCQVCGKGFKRDANLRMHMRAHGDEYKTSAALSNPLKHSASAMAEGDSSLKPPRKYSCPHEGCRWNQKHAKFQPLKSMICVKNHYKRSHCPKMYVCKRCNQKQFSVLSDLRTHEKHCGHLKWQCSCGTTFSRKDKLLGHVSLFAGHAPATISSTRKPAGDVYNQEMQMQLDDRG